MTANDHSQQWQQASTLLEAYYHLDADAIKQTEAYKAASPAVQEKLLKLLANKENHHTLLNQPTKILTSTIKNQDLSGQQLGTYQLVELLAHGGMSSVYRARQTAVASQKDVAIKLIPTSLQTSSTTELFKQELETLSKLHHPNIIDMHHGDVAASGTPYLVMQLVEEALQIDHYIQQHQLTQQAIIELFVTLCQTLHYAHQNRVIHQDIKPSNVVIDQHGHLLVLDFGVAAIAEALPEHQAFTRSYAAPEQQQGQLPTAAFDTFAITSLLIKCLSQGDDDTDNWQQQYAAQLNIDSDLKQILNKGIQANSTDRYASAATLAMDLNLWLQQLPISFLNKHPFYRIKKFIKRQPAVFAMAAITFLSVITGLVFYQQQYRIALSESNKAQQVKNILIDAIDQNDPDISKGDALTVRDMLKQVELSHQENPVTDRNTNKELLMTLGLAFHKLGDYQSATKNLQQALQTDPDDQTTILAMAALELQQNRSAQAAALLAPLAQNSHSLSIENQIKYQLQMAQIHVIDSAFEAAEQAFSTALNLADQSADMSLKIKTISAYADGLLEQDKMDLATQQIEQAATLSETNMGAAHSLTLEMQAKLAETYLSHSGEKVQLATTLFDALIPKQQALLGENHPMVAKSLFLNATAYRALNQLGQAREHAEQALGIAQQQFGSEHVFTAKILMTLGGIYLAENDIVQAISHAKAAVDIHEQHFGAEHHETLQYKTSYVAMLAKNEQHQEALEHLLQILPVQTAKLGANHRATLYVEIVLSKTYAALQRLPESVAVGERCLRNAQQTNTQNIMEVYCALTLENAYFLNQQYDQALQLIENYQHDPLITSQPQAREQFASHKQQINKKEPG